MLAPHSAKGKTTNWLNSATNHFDGTPDRIPTVQEVNGSKEEAGAPATAESNPKRAFDTINFDLSERKSNLQFDPSRTLHSLESSNPASINCS